MKYLITIDKELIHEYHQKYLLENPRCKTLPFANKETIKLFNKDGTPQLTKGGKQKVKKQSINKKDYVVGDCLYGALSLNEILVINDRFIMNAKKDQWGELGIWIAERFNMSNLKISNCLMEYRIFSSTLANKDNDNIAGGIKFLNDGLLVKSGMCLDDNYNIVNPLLINCDYDKDKPRTEIRISTFDDDIKNVYEKIKIHIENFKEGEI